MEEESKSGNYMVSVQGALVDLFSQAMRSAFPDLPDPPVVLTVGKFADYQCNSAMNIAAVRLKSNQHSLWDWFAMLSMSMSESSKLLLETY